MAIRLTPVYWKFTFICPLVVCCSTLSRIQRHEHQTGMGGKNTRTIDLHSKCCYITNLWIYFEHVSRSSHNSSASTTMCPSSDSRRLHSRVFYKMQYFTKPFLFNSNWIRNQNFKFITRNIHSNANFPIHCAFKAPIDRQTAVDSGRSWHSHSHGAVCRLWNLDS